RCLAKDGCPPRRILVAVLAGLGGQTIVRANLSVATGRAAKRLSTPRGRAGGLCLPDVRRLIMSAHDISGGELPSGRFLTSPSGLVLIGFLAIAGAYLWMEHRAHLLGVLVWLPLLLCPLMHFFTAAILAMALRPVETAGERRTELWPVDPGHH